MASDTSTDKDRLTTNETFLKDVTAQQAIDYSSIKLPDIGLKCTPRQRKSWHCTCPRQKGTFLEHVVYFCSLATAAYVGVVIRIYLSELVRWDGVPLFPSLYPQLVGTVIMGIVTSHKSVLAASPPFLYQAIATGLCGSISTFSSWNSDAVSTLLQTEQVAPDNAVRIIGWLTSLLLGLGMFSAALTLGQHIARLSPWADSKQRSQRKHPSVKSRCYVLLESMIWVSVWIVTTILVIVIPYVFSRQDLIFSCVLATLGTYLRWHLAPFNTVIKNFKLGTFLANITGTWIAGCMISLQDFHTEGQLAYDILVGVATGFGGCLTTVSTFAVELASLPLWASYIYALTSILFAHVGLVTVLGAVQWTHEGNSTTY